MPTRAVALLLALPLLAGCTGFGERLLAPGMGEDLDTYLATSFPTTYEARVRWQPDGVGDVEEACVRVTDDVPVTDGDHAPFTGPSGEPLPMTLTAIQAMARAIAEDPDDDLEVLVPPPVPGKVSMIVAPALGETPVWVAIVEVDGCEG